MNEQVGLRGRAWFKALTGSDTSKSGDPKSVLATTTDFRKEPALFLCVVPNKDSRFPCVRDGQVGLEEAYALASHIREVIAEDRDKPPRATKRPIIAIVDVKSQPTAVAKKQLRRCHMTLRTTPSSAFCSDCFTSWIRRTRLQVKSRTSRMR